MEHEYYYTAAEVPAAIVSQLPAPMGPSQDLLLSTASGTAIDRINCISSDCYVLLPAQHDRQLQSHVPEIHTGPVYCHRHSFSDAGKLIPMGMMRGAEQQAMTATREAASTQ